MRSFPQISCRISPKPSHLKHFQARSLAAVVCLCVSTFRVSTLLLYAGSRVAPSSKLQAKREGPCLTLAPCFVGALFLSLLLFLFCVLLLHALYVALVLDLPPPPPLPPPAPPSAGPSASAPHSCFFLQVVLCKQPFSRPLSRKLWNDTSACAQDRDNAAKELQTSIKISSKTNRTQNQQKSNLSCGRRTSCSRTNATAVYFGDSSMHRTHSAQRLDDIRRRSSREIHCSKAQKSKVNSSDLARMLRLQHQHYRYRT